MAISLTREQVVTAMLYIHRSNSLYRSLSSNIVREVASYLSALPLLPICRSRTVTVIHLDNGASRHAEVDVSMHWSHVSCLMDWRTILYLTSTPRCCKIDLITFRVSDLPRMKTVRESPGVLCVAGVCYVFGGRRQFEVLTVSEKYYVQNNQWRPTSPLPTPKFGFNPCHYQAEIYLVEVNEGGKSFDIFNIEHEVYRSVVYQISYRMNGCVSFVVDSDLYLVTVGKWCLRWDLNQLDKKPEYRVVSLQDRNSALSNCTPLLYSGSVYWVNYFSGAIVQFHLGTQQVTETPRPLPS